MVRVQLLRHEYSFGVVRCIDGDQNIRHQVADRDHFQGLEIHFQDRGDRQNECLSYTVHVIREVDLGVNAHEGLPSTQEEHLRGVTERIVRTRRIQTYGGAQRKIQSGHPFGHTGHVARIDTILVGTGPTARRQKEAKKGPSATL